MISIAAIKTLREPKAGASHSVDAGRPRRRRMTLSSALRTERNWRGPKLCSHQYRDSTEFT
jgi:hypothetical protein